MNTIIYIHGGMTFNNKKEYIDYLRKRPISLEKPISWSNDFLQTSLGDRFVISRPYMPCKDNAKYIERKIHFERYIPYINKQTILIGASLGGIFLAKYLSENNLPNKILSVYLICPPFDNTLPSESLVGGFKLPSNLSNIENNCKNLYLLFSKDDDVVPINHSEKYMKKLNKAKLLVYENKNGHFKIQEFPEIIELIKKDASLH